jgi:hypothetical protein
VHFETYARLFYFSRGQKLNLVVQENAREGIVDADPAVVFDEAQFPEFVDEDNCTAGCVAASVRKLTRCTACAKVWETSAPATPLIRVAARFGSPAKVHSPITIFRFGDGG